jgi:hypothetical protein
MSDLDELYDELSDLHAPKKDGSSRSPREERIIAGFEDIERFFEQNGRLPQHGEDKDIFERLYAVRLGQIRASAECRAVLEGLDKHGLLGDTPLLAQGASEELDDDALLEELEGISKSDITRLTHVRPRAEINAAEEIANRTPCGDFDKFKPLFDVVAKDISNGSRQTRQIRKEAGFLKSQIKVGDFFILYGQTVYVAEIGEPIKGSNEAMDARLRVIYSNGTESNLLLDSLRRGLYKDESSRIVSEPSAGPLFSGEVEDGDISSGTIYVLRSKSDHPMIQEHRDVIHKIGVTSGEVNKRLTNAKLDPTFLMADVEVVATYDLSNINRTKLENLLHRFFEPAKLNIEIKDRFGNPIVPREWFLVPLFVIDEVIEKVKDGTITQYAYDSQMAVLVSRK